MHTDGRARAKGRAARRIEDFMLSVSVLYLKILTLQGGIGAFYKCK